MSNAEVTNIVDITETARVAANLEKAFNRELGYEKSVKGKTIGDIMITSDGNSYEILAEFDFPNELGDYQKAVVVKSGDEVYFHFNGTGDGNWHFNAAAYGAEPQPSEMQTRCAKWFDETYERLTTQLNEKGEPIITSTDKIYVTGHSQGGNNAMYVTMRSKHADKIDLCVPLDGPGFSDKFVSDTKEILGEDYYKQADKIWAFNGEYDFVSLLGQNSIVPEGHTKYIKYSKGAVESLAEIINFHTAEGLIDENGNFLGILDDDSDLRKRLASAVEKIKDLPQEEQALAANVTMALCENLTGTPEKEPRKQPLTSEEFNSIKPYLTSILIELLAYNPEELAENIQFLLNTDYETAQAIANLISKFDSYPEEIREQIISGVLDCVKYENGEIDLDFSSVPKVVIDSLPVLVETLITNPNDVWTVVQGIGLDKAVGDWIKENPWKTAGIIAVLAITSQLWAPVVLNIALGGLIVDIGIRVIQGVVDIAVGVKDAILDFFDFVKNAIDKVKEWFHNKFDKGAKYVKEHPYFKADTDKLCNYASRLQSVNSRLISLDRDLRSLYWQVGFLDLWEILCANMLTCESKSLNKAKNYLTDTADRLSIADNKAKGYLEG